MLCAKTVPGALPDAGEQVVCGSGFGGAEHCVAARLCRFKNYHDAGDGGKRLGFRARGI